MGLENRRSPSPVINAFRHHCIRYSPATRVIVLHSLVRRRSLGSSIMAPISIAILTYGQKGKGGDLCFKAMGASPEKWRFCDLKGALWNPAGKRDQRVPHQVDGSDAMVWNAILSQDAVPGLLMEWVDYIVAEHSTIDRGGDARHIAAACWTGWHRAWCFGKLLCIVLNRLDNGSGERMFNAQHFPCQMYDTLVHVEGVFKQAHNWVADPWNLAIGGSGRDVSLLHGYEFAQQRSEAARNYDSILAEVDRRNWSEASFADALGNGEVEEVVDDDSHGKVEAEFAEEDHSWGALDGAGSSVDVGASPMKRQIVVPPPPPPLPAFVRVKRIVPISPPSQAKVAKTSDVDVDMVKHLEWGGAFDPSNWSEILTTFDASVNSQMQLLLLSQYGQKGLKHANNIVSQVITGKVNKVSSFIHKAVQNARTEIGL